MSQELLDAVKKENIEKVKTLLKKGANPNYNNGFSTDDSIAEIPLFRAVESGNFEITKILLQNRANPNILESRHGNSIIKFAADNGKVDILNLLFFYGGDIDDLNTGDYFSELNNKNCRKLIDTIYYLKHYKLFLSFIRNDNLNEVTSNLQNTYQSATWHDNSTTRYKINPNDDAGLHGSPIPLAIKYASPIILDTLIKYGANPNKKSAKYQQTPLSIAVTMHKYQHALTLINNGANIENLTKDEKSLLLDLAILNDDFENVRKLFEQKITPYYVTDSNINSPKISNDMKALVQQYNLKNALPTLGWMSIQKLFKQAEEHGISVLNPIFKKNVKLVPLAYKCGYLKDHQNAAKTILLHMQNHKEKLSLAKANQQSTQSSLKLKRKQESSSFSQSSYNSTNIQHKKIKTDSKKPV